MNSTFYRPQRPEVARGVRVLEFVPSMVVLTAVFVGIGAWLLRRTRFGRHAYAIGGNLDAATRAGINPGRHLAAVYMISALFASLSGVIYMLEYVTGKADAGFIQLTNPSVKPGAIC